MSLEGSPRGSRPETGPNRHYQVVAIPLNRPSVGRFLSAPGDESRGQAVQIIGQRPTAAAEAAWTGRLASLAEPTVADLLAIDDPHHNLVDTVTGRLIPRAKLADPGYLTRNLGGWAPIYFAVIGLTSGVDPTADPVLRHAQVLVDYGPRIRFFGADPGQVRSRLAHEVGLEDTAALARAFSRVGRLRRRLVAASPTGFVERLYQELVTGRFFERPDARPIPPPLIYDALLGDMIRIELTRRQIRASGDAEPARLIEAWQERARERYGLQLILKGEYVVGRARRSSVLIAPELGVVIKQPGPEPCHEIELAARIYKGAGENWPYLTHDGSLVTPRGRLRLIVEEGLLAQIARVFSREITFATLLGLTVEAYLPGDTIQQHVLADPDRMTPALYEAFVLHQQVCELMGIENGDWHAANFMRRPGDGGLVHIDWGAARPLRPDELRPEDRLARLNQMENIAFSFHDRQLAERVRHLHQALISDSGRLAQVQERARSLVRRAGLLP